MKKLTPNDLSNFSDYQVRKERIKSGRLIVEIDSDGNLLASSYDHWKFVSCIKGVYFFNWYKYSNTTRKHQWETADIMKSLGLDYVTIKTRLSLTSWEFSLDKVLAGKIEALYSRENELSLSRATKHAVYTEDAFNGLLTDIRVIAKCLSIPDSKLDSMLLEAETKATEALMTQLLDNHTKSVTRRALIKENQNLEAITL